MTKSMNHEWKVEGPPSLHHTRVCFSNKSVWMFLQKQPPLWTASAIEQKQGGNPSILKDRNMHTPINIPQNQYKKLQKKKTYKNPAI